MLRLLVSGLLTLVSVVVTLAQVATPDYAIRNIRHRFADENRQVIVEFEVWNLGTAATVPATVTLNVIATGQQIATDVVPPLGAQDIRTVSLTFPSNLFQPGSVESFRAAIGVGEVEAAGATTTQNNFAQISITVPESSEAAVPTAPPATEAARKDVLTEFIESLGAQINLSDPAQAGMAAVICAAGVILLLIVIVILRLIFQRPPEPVNWMPPYANMPPLDPNLPAGRRQGWQMHAQNASLPAPGTEGSVHVRKLLTGIDNSYLTGWRVSSLRISQYDMYGRINRSQVTAPKGLVRRFSGIVRRRNTLTREQIHRRLLPVAGGLVRRFRKKVNPRTVMLPAALDIRLEGRHGEVRIWFELYQSQYNSWVPLDRWEPEMAVAGKIIHESYTYSVYGQRSDETFKRFCQRLQEDLALVMAELIAPPTPNEDTRSAAPTNPNIKPVDVSQ